LRSLYAINTGAVTAACTMRWNYLGKRKAADEPVPHEEVAFRFAHGYSESPGKGWQPPFTKPSPVSRNHGHFSNAWCDRRRSGSLGATGTVVRRPNDDRDRLDPSADTTRAPSYASNYTKCGRSAGPAGGRRESLLREYGSPKHGDDGPVLHPISSRDGRNSLAEPLPQSTSSAFSRRTVTAAQSGVGDKRRPLSC